MNTTLSSLETLSYAIESNGIAADPITLNLLADDARDLGVKEVLIDIMVDDRQPPVARVRAYARVSTSVAALRYGPTSHYQLALAC
jgi:hypothetical protein